MIVKIAFPVALKREFDYMVPENLKTRIKPALRVNASFGHRNLTGFITKIETKYRKPRNITLKQINSLIDETDYFDGKLLPLAKFISYQWGSPLGLVLSALVPDYMKGSLANNTGFPLKSGAGLTSSNKEEMSLPADEAISKKSIKPILTAVENKTSKTFVIFYDPHMKTEKIYLQILTEIYRKKLQGLLLVPDIAMTTIFDEKMQNIFGHDKFAVWHARISPTRRKEIYHKLSAGETMIILGTRSASLLPFKNLSAVIIDEQQDDMYKQENAKPYYDSRKVLLWRSKQNGFPLILSSATPSLDTIHETVNKTTELIRLHRTPEISKPQITITPRTGTQSKIISDELLRILGKTFTENKKALVILNRKGIENAYVCHNCSWSCKCDKCNIQMTKQNDILICPKCKNKKPLPLECPKCRNRIFKIKGYGIKNAASEFRKFFPDKKIIQFHCDKLTTRNEMEFTLDAIKKMSADLIIGTRFIERAYGFGKLGCVAFLNTDIEKHSPDYKSSEKTAYMLFKALGYLEAENSFLVVQTSQKEDAVFSALKKRSYLDFAFTELESRSRFKYPPYSKLVRVVLTGKELKKIEKTAKKIITLLEKTIKANSFEKNKDFEILGPASFGFETKNLQYHFMVKYFTGKLDAIIRQVLDNVIVKKPLAVKIIFDPVGFY